MISKEPLLRCMYLRRRVGDGWPMRGIDSMAVNEAECTVLVGVNAERKAGGQE